MLWFLVSDLQSRSLKQISSQVVEIQLAKKLYPEISQSLQREITQLKTMLE
jgi:hypothetical protein